MAQLDLNATSSASRNAPSKSRVLSDRPPPSDKTDPSSSEDKVGPKRYFASNSDSFETSPWFNKLLLSLDGGGVRGYSSLLILQELIYIIVELETGKRLFKGKKNFYRFKAHVSSADPQIGEYQEAVKPECMTEYKNSSERPANVDTSSFLIHHYFDYVAGTSTGGLSAIMLSRLRMDVTSALEQYAVVGDQVFGRPNKIHVFGIWRSKYKSSRIEAAIQDVIRNGIREKQQSGHLGSSGLKREAQVKKLVDDNRHACQTAVIANGGDGVNGTYILRSYNRYASPFAKNSDHKLGNLGPAHSASLWEAARATSAAPRYFDEIVIGREVFKDGGMGANNPANEMRSDIEELHGADIGLILSIGTGKLTTEQKAEEELRASSAIKKHALFERPKKFFSMLKYLANIVTDSETTHCKLQKSMDESRQAGTTRKRYFRFNVEGITGIQLDSWRPRAGGADTLGKLRESTEAYLNNANIKKQLEECAIDLVRLRRKRASTERWEQFATDRVYRCKENGRCAAMTPTTREEMRLHLLTRHQWVTCATLDGERLCTLDRCALRPTRIQNDSEFVIHLGTVHRMPAPKLKTLDELEARLQICQTTIHKEQNDDLDRQSNSRDGLQQSSTHTSSWGHEAVAVSPPIVHTTKPADQPPSGVTSSTEMQGKTKFGTGSSDWAGPSNHRNNGNMSASSPGRAVTLCAADDRSSSTFFEQQHQNSVQQQPGAETPNMQDGDDGTASASAQSGDAMSNIPHGVKQKTKRVGAETFIDSNGVSEHDSHPEMTIVGKQNGSSKPSTEPAIEQAVGQSKSTESIYPSKEEINGTV